MSHPEPQLDSTHASVVTEDQIDELGHMNVRWYAHNAFAATAEMGRRLGLRAQVASAYTRHHHEQLLDNPLEVRSGLLGGGNRLRVYHELRNRVDGDLAATFVHELDHPRLEAPTIGLPRHGTPRSIGLDSDALASAPTLEDALADGLALRHPRSVGDEDLFGERSMQAWAAPSLVWGGDPTDGSHEWLRAGPNGESIGWATMESRLWFGTLPTPGTRIQSFGATVGLADKTKHSMGWAFDLASGELLIAFESINLAFDVGARRAIAIPPDERAEEQARLRPDLAPLPPSQTDAVDPS